MVRGLLKTFLSTVQGLWYQDLVMSSRKGQAEENWSRGFNLNFAALYPKRSKQASAGEHVTTVDRGNLEEERVPLRLTNSTR